MPSVRGRCLLGRGYASELSLSPLQANMEGVRRLLNRVVGRHLRLNDDVSLYCEPYALPF